VGKPSFIDITSAIFIFVINLVKALHNYYAGRFNFGLLWHLCWLIALVPIGVWLGRKLVRKLTDYYLRE